ncbi:MAG: class I SAM-dependent methyltransferase [Rhodospirillales bacterium]|nr:class I SAM-dependent methyltransferase [Rhodospirillales bacterium]
MAPAGSPPALNPDMVGYYARRAPDYDDVYRIPARAPELAALRAWLAEAVRGRDVLEGAAGTGHWTAVAATTARRVVATDVNAAMLAHAAARGLGPHVSLRPADAFDLPLLPDAPNTAMAHLWWSHLRRGERGRFLAHLRSRVQPNARPLMLDECDHPDIAPPASRHDAEGNGYEARRLADGEVFAILKNYPDDAELRADLALACDAIEIRRGAYFWAVQAVFR